MAKNTVSAQNATSKMGVTASAETAAQKYVRELMELEAREKELIAIQAQRRALMESQREVAAGSLKETIEAAIAEINATGIGSVNKQIEALNSLGYHYRLLSPIVLGEGGRKIRSTGNTASTAANPVEPKDMNCPLCNIAGHNKKAHRFSATAKDRAYTDAELTELGYATREQALAGVFPARNGKRNGNGNGNGNGHTNGNAATEPADTVNTPSEPVLNTAGA